MSCLQRLLTVDVINLCIRTCSIATIEAQTCALPARNGKCLPLNATALTPQTACDVRSSRLGTAPTKESQCLRRFPRDRPDFREAVVISSPAWHRSAPFAD